MRRLILLLFLFATSASAFTLEEIMSLPFASELHASPAKNRVVWLQNDRGARNLWIAEGPEWRARKLTAYDRDHGIDVGEISFTPDGESVVFTRGGDLETGGESPNPRSLAGGVEEAIDVVSVRDGSVRKLAEGHEAAVSPGGDRVAFVAKKQLWLVPFDGSAKPEAIISTTGERSNLRWSPDGSRIAFVSGRREHAFIGVYDVAAKTITYLDPSVDRDVAPVWSPDSKRIAFLRIPSTRERIAFTPHRTAIPWSIRIADPATGKGTQVWRAEPGMGSAFYGIDGDEGIFWAAGDRIVFPWERDGWRHLYSIGIGEKSAMLLTPGDFEVEHASMSPDRKTIVYSSNQNDIDRRHIWRVSPAGGAAVAVTSGTAIEVTPVVTSDDRTIAFIRSDAIHPAHPAIVGRELTEPASLPLVTPQQVIFPAADGLSIHGQLFLPAGSGKHPAVVFFHGGSRRQMLLGWHYMDYYSNAYAMNQYLASRGWIVLSVNYRSGIGYGLDFREAENYGAAGASEYNDVIGAALYLRSRSDVIPAKIGVWGGSYGGYLTALALARASNLFAAGVDFHGVHDWNAEVRHFTPSYDPQATPEIARTAWLASPMSSVDQWKSPVLLIQGDDDRNVPFTESIHLAEELRKRGVDVETLVFPDEIHDFLLWESWVRAYHAASDFLNAKITRTPAAPAGR